MISANGGLPAHRYTPQVTPGWPRGSEPASAVSAPPGVLPRSRATFGLLGGGGGPVPVPPYLAWGSTPPMGSMSAWAPVTNPTARALASCLCPLWARHEGAQGGAPLAWVWGVPGRALSHPDHSSFRACDQGPLPAGCGCGGCGRGDLSPTSQRPLLRAGFARFGGGARAPGGGASCLVVGRAGTGALPL